MTQTLKEITKQAHADAEHTAISQAMIKGTISDNQWYLWLRQKYMMFFAIEKQLNMSARLSRSIDIFDDVPPHARDLPILDSTSKYVHNIFDSPAKSVHADLYVHFLGEVYGGQFIKKSLPWHFGTKHLTFDQTQKEELVSYIRNLIQDRDQELAPRALAAFEQVTHIHNDILAYLKQDS